MTDKRLRWGICTTGPISAEFANSILLLKDAENDYSNNIINGVAARNEDSAASFSLVFDIPHVFSSYEKMAESPEIDIVYIGSINSQHLPLTQLFLKHGKHVICEKAFTLDVANIDSVYRLARENNLLLMENRWSCCFPIYELIRGAIEKGEIGDIESIEGFFETAIKKDYQSLNPEFHSGGLADIGVYLLNLTFWTIPPNRMQDWKFTANGSALGVDIAGEINVQFGGANQARARLVYNAQKSGRTDFRIQGSKGSIQIDDAFWCPTRVIINGEVHERPVPNCTTGIPTKFRNSTGFTYLISHAYELIVKQKVTTSSVCTLETTKFLANFMHDCLKSQGFKNFPQTSAGDSH